jgi:hypothetical protein
MSDIRLEDNAVIVEGNLGIGTDSPQRTLHVEGSEIHSGGANGGFSFTDRHVAGLGDSPGHRWVWYAEDSRARLWSGGEDVLTIVGSSTDPKDQHPSSLQVSRIHSTTANIGVIQGIFQEGTRLAIEASALMLSGGPTVGGGNFASIPQAGVLTLGQDFKTVKIHDINFFSAGVISTGLASLGNSGLEILDTQAVPGQHTDQHSVQITASSILVRTPNTKLPKTDSPASAIAATHEGGVHIIASTDTLDLIAEVRALRAEVNALKDKAGIK